MKMKYFDVDKKEPINEKTEIPVDIIFKASFHGELWYQCSACGYQFEIYKAVFNNNRCPNCGKLLRL